jgi:hypothetical protein
MIHPRYVILLMLVTALSCYAQSDIYFLPCSTNATVSFEGETQAGRDIHRLEIRRLAYLSGKTNTKTELDSGKSCVVYFAGEEYGPSILLQLDDCIEPLVKRVSKNVVEIYFSVGAHGHIRQRWKLLGWTAKLLKEEAIDWHDDPRMKAK